MAFLYDTLLQEFGKRAISQVTVPTHLSDNLKFGQRPYQQEAFQRFILCHSENFAGKPNKPLHLLYNMATGSGKTLVMAGLMLQLYEKGYRNFLFFVNSNNIIQKTKDNFLNPQTSKYLFNDKVVINGKEVFLKQIDNFDEADYENINIKFTTIQQLHIDLNNTKENSITYEDFTDKKIVMIADEAHHLSSGTKAGNLFGSWEETVLKILHQNFDNILLEFTATLDYESREIINKYKDKVIYKYDLSQFRTDKFSKEINLVRSLYDEKERIIQALILNLYRQELATTNNINLKPVILFKAKKTIKESEQNKDNFHKLIDDLSEQMIEKIRKTSTVPIVHKAFQFFETKNISLNEVAQRIHINFREENCLSANNDSEAEKNQILLNTLEDENNPIRAVFAVQKLNEGWDVLNLFDIVRLYEDRDGKDGNPGKTTLSEAQLIGRGARYFPFALEQGDDKFVRKYDDDVSNDLKILEELYYHTKEDSRYISELKKALVETGIYEDDVNLETKKLTLKPIFKNSELYKKGYVFSNKKLPKNFDKVKSFMDLGVTKTNYRHQLSSGGGRVSNAFFELESPVSFDEVIKPQDIQLKDIPKHVIGYALSRNPFYYFDNLSRYFPNIRSHSDFIEDKNYLGNLEITFLGSYNRLREISHFDYLQALNGLLQSIEVEIKNNSTDYEGSEYYPQPIHQVFRDKEIRVNKYSERAKSQSETSDRFRVNLDKEDWFSFNDNFGTIEEKAFVSLFSRRFEGFSHKFENIHLIRNEREIKIFDKYGRAFEPDFLLFCSERANTQLTFQVFIEPKGAHLIGYDKWKEDFLKVIGNEQKSIKMYTDTYKITAVPFYNYGNENEFKKVLESTFEK
ncbi:type III deoxyribonuclease [Chryseobacterium shigense]|uniref:Type III restriction enzyme n=1 Tax=Chryseobacterium shigense TaxID=297244 RepID=A0A1N7I657_9FLAO|nr:DEAD/DEAH box helicase family protein [Chryseobacterium shigense]PQA95262.1 type III deoxyribonuclease [Chryseobacterium shigense]SIS32531.1 type III restriction enzyme [Chryseobacterium shigense]